jgi:uncharacterized protein with NAD-binding domain and iron-sulfur cluster
MNIVIAGGGVAGLSAAVVLRKLPFVKSIVILEKAVVSVYSSSKSNSGDVTKDETNHHRYNGLWSPALQCLQSMGIYSKIERHLEGVRCTTMIINIITCTTIIIISTATFFSIFIIIIIIIIVIVIISYIHTYIGVLLYL